jgi:hypothetical protein
MYSAIYEYEHKVAFAGDLSIQQRTTRPFTTASTDVTQRGLQFELIAWANLASKASSVKSTE